MYSVTMANPNHRAASPGGRLNEFDLGRSGAVVTCAVRHARPVESGGERSHHGRIGQWLLLVMRDPECGSTSM